jgi:hypothetical protein
MFTIHLNVGLASKYLITDTKKCIVSIEKPYLVFSNNILSDKVFAEILTTFYNFGLPRGLFGVGVKKLNSQQVELSLDDLRNERKPSFPMREINNPMLMLSNGFDKKTLTAIKIIKIRGFCQIIAADISALPGDTILKIDSELMSDKIEEKLSYKIYKPDNRLCVVSGINKTVLSTESNVGQILKKFPDLISNVDLESINEPLLELG